jgi:hypothetical protein
VALDVELANDITSGVTSSVAWADFDQDGYWEIVVGDQQETGNQTTLYQQDGADGKFYPDPSFPLAGAPVSSINWNDFDNNGEIDLVCVGSSENGAVITYSQDAQLGQAASLGSFTSLSFTDSKILDFNLDGWPDLLLTNWRFSQLPALLSNLMGDERHSAGFVDIGEVAIEEERSQKILGIYVDDFDMDGDYELFLGREDCDTGTFYSGYPTPGNDPVKWVDIKLDSYLSKHPYGAMVQLSSVSSSEFLGTQVLDGGSGRGGQSPHILRFGLGDFNSPISVKVKWPLGPVETQIIQPTEFSTPSSQSTVTISQYMGCTTCLDENSVDWEMLVGPGGQIEWRFTWITDYWTDPALDEVSYQPVSNCGTLTAETLQPGITPGVTGDIKYVFDKDTEEVYFEHTLKYSGVSCFPNCGISYTVKSSDGQWIGATTSASKTAQMPKICPVSN